MITEVRCHPLTAPLHTPFVTALRSTTTLQTTVVEVVDSDGLSGYGEAPQVWQVTGESLAGATAALTGPLADVARGRNPDDLAELSRDVQRAILGNFGAKAAMDVALHDLAARRIGLSLPRLLGASTHQIRTDVTLSAGEAAELAKTAAQRVADGFGCLKLKVGTDEHDLARIRAVREAAPGARLRLDANQGWTPKQAIAIVHAMEDEGIEVDFVEQPVPAWDLDGLARVTAAVDTKIMADESVFGLRDLSRVIEAGAADLVNVKLAKCGGLRIAIAMLELARTHGLGTLVGSMMEGPIGVGAAASLVAAMGTTEIPDLDAAWWTETSPIQGGLTYDGPTLHLPEAPGLGVDGLVA